MTRKTNIHGTKAKKQRFEVKPSLRRHGILGNISREEAERVLSAGYPTVSKEEIQSMSEMGLISAPVNSYPVVVPHSGWGGRGFDVPSLMASRRVLHMHGPVSMEVVRYLCMLLHFLSEPSVLAESTKQENKKTGMRPCYRLNVDSPGGYVSWGLTLFSYLRQTTEDTGLPLETLIQTMGASMGSLLPQAATKGMRFMLPDSTMMVHDLSYGNEGKTESQQRQLADSLRQQAKLKDIYIRKILEAKELFEGADVTDLELQVQTVAVVEKLLRHDTYLSPAACMKLGLTDFVIFNAREQEEYTNAVLWYMGLATYDGGTQELTPVEQTTGEHGGDLNPVEISPEEREEALALIRKLRNENLKKAEEYELSTAYLTAVTEAIGEAYKKEATGVRMLGASDIEKLVRKNLKARPIKPK